MDQKIAVQAALLQQLFSTNIRALVTSTSLGAILAYIQRDVIDHAVVYAWFSLIVLLMLFRIALVIAYRRSVANVETATHAWLARVRLGVLATGLAWGSSSILLFPADHPQYQIFLVVMLVGLTAGGLVSYATDLISAIIFNVSVLVPLIIRLAVTENSINVAMSAALMLYLGFFILSLRYINRSVCENIALRFEADAREKAVRLSEQRYRLLLNHAPVGIVHYNTGFAITYCNDRLADMLCNSVQSITGLDMKTLNDQSIMPAMKKALEGQAGHYEGQYVATFSKVSRWVSMICASSRDDAGKIVGGVAIIQDISERKLAEAGTAKSLSLLQATLESSNDAILVVDLNNTWVLHNQRFIDLWQIPDEISAARDDNAALAYVLDQLEDADVFLERVRELYATPEANSFDVINFKGGRVIERSSIPQRIDGKVVGRVWSFRDITERKLAETRLRQAKEQAESATRLKDQFVTLISHDLRSPLISIKGMLDLAGAGNHKGLRDMDKNRTFDRIAKSTEGLIALIERLLDHNRLQSGSMKPEMRFINVRSLAEEQIGRISHLASVKNITIHNTLPEAMHIYVDPDLYGEVIHNLLSNAIKFTNSGGAITILPSGESTVIVRDNGVGIDEKMLPNLFNIGVKTTTYGTGGERGNGLGLPYSFDIMKAHGGSLTAVPIKGAGTEFHVTLPRHDTIVLIVDDQDIQRAIMKDMLAKLDSIQVVEACNGADAMDKLQYIMPAIIVTDIQMPVMDGFELVRQIRNMPQYEMVPIMAVTAFAGADPAELREKLLALGADDFIAKPLAEEDFLPVVARYLGIA
jgi:PAS domain S-box-containing protein